MAKLLIVEDQAELREKLTSLLAGEGHTVQAASRGDEAAGFLRSSAYDAIVLDWNLPGLSGYEICRQFRAEGEPHRSFSLRE